MDLQTNIGNLSGNVERDIKALHSAVFNLAEEVRYMMNNLDVTNFNDLGLARYENGRLQIYTEQMDIRTEKLTAEFRAADAEMKTTIEASVDGLESTVTSLSGTVDGLGDDLNALSGTVSSNYSSLSSRITQNASKISAVVSAVDDSSGNVTAASIVAAINSAGSSVKISADHVDITGFVTFTDLSTEGKTTINGANIITKSINANCIFGGTLRGVTLISASGTLENNDYEDVTIENGMIDFFGAGSIGGGSRDLFIVPRRTLYLGDANFSGTIVAFSDGTAWELTSRGWVKSSSMQVYAGHKRGESI